MEFNAGNWLHRYWKAEGVRREHWGKARDNCKRPVPLLGVEQQRGREWNYKNPGAWRKSPAEWRLWPQGHDEAVSRDPLRSRRVGDKQNHQQIKRKPILYSSWFSPFSVFPTCRRQGAKDPVNCSSQRPSPSFREQHLEVCI